MTERELLVDCLHRLNRTGVVYYLTGSMASNYWGIPRTTHDLDFVVQFPATAVPLIFNEFSGDFYIEEAAVRAVYEPPHQFNAIDTRSALKVDFWLAGSEPFDQEMLRRRVQATLFGDSMDLDSRGRDPAQAPLESDFAFRPSTRGRGRHRRGTGRRTRQRLPSPVGRRTPFERRAETLANRRDQAQRHVNFKLIIRRRGWTRI
jgi:hypothetical protein